MNLTAANGILIVAIFVALGIHKADDIMIALGFALAGTSYITNVCDEFEVSDFYLRYVTMIVGVLGYLWAALLLLSGSGIANVQ